MIEKKKKTNSAGGGALLKKYGPNYFKELAERKHAIDRKAKALWTKTQKQKMLLKKQKKQLMNQLIPTTK